MQTLEERLIRFSFFFFINTKSGNKQGGRILSLSKVDLIKDLQPQNGIELQFIDIFDQKSFLESMLKLKSSLRDQSTAVRIVICGGDGTIGRMLNELESNGIILDECIFGVLPIGSGNDFCRSLGWPAESFDCTKESIIKRVKQWIESPIEKYDVWQTEIQVQKNGKIQDIRDRKEYILPEKSLKKIFINYLGVGLDARVTYFSQRIRTSSAYFNKILYGIIGTFNYLIPMKQLKKKIQKITNLSSDAADKSPLLSEETAELQMQSECIKQGRTPFAPNDEVRINMKKKYRGFVCLNSTSCMAGVRDSWKTKKIAVTSNLPQRIWTPQSHGDGKVEFIAYKNELSLALERCIRMGGRVMQGSGPFQITFNKNSEGEETYIQIDGQSMKVTNLKAIKISKASKIQSHQINVMIKAQ